eukprot:3144895-Alexandrium_andersonii.AAC.1
MLSNCWRRSGPDLRGRRRDLKAGPRSSQGVRSAPLFALMSNLTTNRVVLEVPGGSRGCSEGAPRML